MIKANKALLIFTILISVNILHRVFRLITTQQLDHRLLNVAYSKSQRILYNNNANAEYLVSWTLSLGKHESLLESPFLKAGFEQSVKDYMNNDIRCKGDGTTNNTSFLSVIFVGIENTKEKMKKAISGNGKCAGDKKACSKSMNKRKESNEELLTDLIESGVLDIESRNKADFCDEFLKSSIFGLFKEKILTASKYDYDVDVGVLNDLKGALNLQYEVKFKPTEVEGLNQVDEFNVTTNDEPIEINSFCLESQCFSQRDTMRSIFEYYEIPFDENKHECLNNGINCDADGLVTYIWMGMC